MEKKNLRSDKIAKKSSCKNIVTGEKEKYYAPSHSGEKTALCRFQCSIWPDTEWKEKMNEKC